MASDVATFVCGPSFTALIAVAGTLSGVGLGFGLTWLRERGQRKRVRRGHFEALTTEIRICSALAETYLKSGIPAPAYRAPLIAYDHSLPALLAEGVLSGKDSDAILNFYVNTNSFNLCLDQVQGARAADNDKQFGEEARRALLKAQNAMPGTRSTPALYDKVIAVMKKHLPAESVRRLEIDFAGEQ